MIPCIHVCVHTGDFSPCGNILFPVCLYDCGQVVVHTLSQGDILPHWPTVMYVNVDR